MTHGSDQAAARRAHGGLWLPLVWILLSLALLGNARAAGTGYWHTSGNQILDASNQPVRIAAVNWYGFETSTFVAHGLWIADYKAILNLIKSSGFNTVRIPYSDQMIQQNPVLGTMNINRNGINTDIAANATALDVLDKIIAYSGTIGLRVIIDNHRSNAGNSAQENGLWFTADFPESTWLANWRALTTRYLGNTTVIGMDLRNEPHASACWGGDPSGCSAANDWQAAATRAGNAILAINPSLLIFVEGNDHYNNAFSWWGGMLRGVASRPVALSVANRVVYSAHDYGPAEANQSWFNGSTTATSLAAVWNQNWGFIHNNGTAPIFIGEMGTLNGNADIQSSTPGSQGQWFSSLVQYVSGKPSMGWAYWAMNGNDRYALFNVDFNGIVNQSKLTLLQQLQFPLDQQPGNTPAISGVNPASGAVGSSVTLSGSNFGTSQGTSSVRFGTTVATVTSWSAAQIVATVPNVASGAQSVTVTVNGISSNAGTFTVATQQQAPAITSLNPTSGTVGSTVTINGSNFGASQSTSTVRFGSTNATVTSWSNTQVSATVPGVSGTVAVTLLVGGLASNAASFAVTTTPTPNYSLTAASGSLTVNRGASGSVVVTITRSGGFTGAVAFTATGLPTGVSASFSPASTTGNSTTLTLSASSTATLGNASLTINGSNATVGARSVPVSLTVASAPGGGSATITGVVTSSSPWFMEEQVRMANPSPITALTAIITVARNPSALAVGGQYNTLGGVIAQSTTVTSTQLVYTYQLAAGQTIAAGTGRTFAAQISGNGTPHPTSGDSWSVTYTSGGTTTTASGTF
ncbi:MAG TPA: cellulase family glycosylhydrolase [Steroidobacteraceae bacterium]|jgi:endoglucanase|nr:cellulase family glycosylhydrolase [Steroidobacteraceae bacterium]